MKKLFVISIILTLFSASSNADEVTCKRILGDCSTALDAQVKSNELQKLIIADQDKRHDLDMKQIQTLEDRDSAWYRSPILYLWVGTILGGYLVTQIQK